VSTDISFQFDILVRLLAAALWAPGLGLEREVHGHQAGMRTHMLVALGSAIFTVLSIYGFPKTPDTASRIRPASPPRSSPASAFSAPGRSSSTAPTSAASPPRPACGSSPRSDWRPAGAYFLAVAGTFIALLALWPLHVLVGKLNLQGGQLIRLEMDAQEARRIRRAFRVSC
jgi:uncharacterized membrane protein YhiD involved in acid resistance